METRHLPLRILYTVSGSQYILARSSSSVPVVVVPSIHNSSQSITTTEQVNATTSQVESPPEFGTASLKTCLDAICTSSPELVQDKRRDFSVYVLDPLESNSAPARVNIPNAISQPSSANPAVSEQSRGLAVALGLMSWAMMPDERDSTPVTGTVIKLPTGQEALEVIFALKETAAMEKSSLPAALRTWGLPPQPTVQPSNVHDESIQTNVSIATTAPSTTYNSTTGQAVGSFQHAYAAYSQLSTPNSSGASTSTASSYLGQIPADVTTLATIASIQMRSQHKRAKAKAKKPAKAPFINPENSEADRLLLSHYVGPEKRKAGRPPNAIASGSRSSKASRNVEAPPATANSGHLHAGATTTLHDAESKRLSDANPDSHAEKNSIAHAMRQPPFTSAPLIRSPRDPEPQSLLDILAFLSASSSSTDPTIQNTALLAALSAIDSGPVDGTSTGTEKPPGPLLVNALRELISAIAQKSAQSASTSNTTHLFANNHGRSHPADDDIVLLDKENVNPTVFRRRSERASNGKLTDTETPAPSSNLGSILAPGQIHVEPPPAARGLTARSNSNVNTTAVVPTPISAPHPNSSSSSGVRRKRTLSDFMDEREASKDKGKGREREWVERRDAHRYAHSSPKRNELSASRHYPRLASDNAQPLKRASGSYYRTGMEPWTSPPRPRPSDQNHKSNENSRLQPITVEDSPGTSRIPASSPVKSSNPRSRRPYVVPAWARTSTSTQPRLSEEALRALELAEERKKEESKAARKKGAFRAEKEKKKKPISRRTSSSRQESQSSQNTSIPLQSQCAPPVTVAGDCPVFAITSAIQDRITAFSTPSSEPSAPSSPRSTDPAPPCTPPRKRYSDVFSPGEDGSLFTPMPGRNLTNTRTPVGFKPMGSTKKTPSQKSPKIAIDGNEASGEESEDDFGGALNQELDNALDELDLPSSSLPTVSSDTEMENDPPSALDEDAMPENSDTDVENPKKQHWVGLPPSSPPPPTSPLLMPQDEESDDAMLPAVMSDADPCPTDSEVYTDSFYSNEPSTCTDEELAEYLSSDFASIFGPNADQTSFETDSMQAGMEIFDEFTNHNIPSDGVTNDNTTLEPSFDLLPNGLPDFDLTEFWETFKPLLQDQNCGGTTGSIDASRPTLDDPTFDPMKLAEDVQALFSGCVM